MAGERNLETRLIATDDASKVIDKVADKLEELEKQGDAAIEITADDKASADIRTISQRLAGLSDEDKTIVIKAQVADAERDVERILRSLSRVDEMDDEEVQIRVEALGNARQRLDEVQAELAALDGETANVKVEASGLDNVSDKLGALPGQLGEIGGALGSLGAAGGIGALVAGLAAAMNAQADMAIAAKTTADLTGATVEEASKLQTLWGRTGADVNDLNDVLLQMNGVLSTTPELARQLGINLQDGRSITERFVQVTDMLAAGQLTAQQASQLFGEEGVRQVGKLRTMVGALGDDLADIEAPVDEAAVADAIAYKNAIAEMTEAFKLGAGVYAKQLVSTFGDLAGIAEDVTAALPGGAKAKDVLGFVQEWGTGLGVVSNVLDKVTGGSEDVNAANSEGVDLWDRLNNTIRNSAEAVNDAVRHSRDYSTAQDLINDSIAESLDLLQKQRAAEQEMADGRRAAADSTFALRDAQRDFNDRLTEWVELTGPESTATMQDLAAAMDATAQSAGNTADAQVKLTEDMKRAAGQTLSAKDAQYIWNGSMIDSARTAEGPLRDAIINYIATVNGIPPEKVSEILADPQYDTIEAAAGALDQAAADREAELLAEARTAQAEKDLEHAARDRDATINARANLIGSAWNQIFRATGTSATVSSAPAPAGLRAAPATGGGVAVAAPMAAPIVINVPAPRLTPSITVQAGVIGSRYDIERVVARATRTYERRAGRRRP